MERKRKERRRWGVEREEAGMAVSLNSSVPATPISG